MLILLWFIALGLSLWLRPYLPIDETRYISVAWEMWQRGDFLVPYLNGEPYAHKPPLLFWLYQLSWSLFGINDWSPRLIAPLFALGSLFLTQRIANALWPDQIIGQRAAWILFSSLFWLLYSTAAMFDMLLVFFVLLSLYALIRAAQGQQRAWLYFSLGIGLGLLSKGPVILLHTLPAALSAPWWSAKPLQSWYRPLFLSLSLGLAIALAWALPAAWRGGPDYAQAILWGQTAERMVSAFAHQRPVYWYLPLLPLLFFPWLLRPELWQRVQKEERLLWIWISASLISLSLISSKQVHYLLPIFPALALLLAHRLQKISLGWALSTTILLLLLFLYGLHRLQLAPAWFLIAVPLIFYAYPMQLEAQLKRLALAVFLAVIGLQWSLQPYFNRLDLKPLAQRIHQLQKQGQPIYYLGDYEDQFHFLGRLQQPIPSISKQQLPTWLPQHRQDWLIVHPKAGQDCIDLKHYPKHSTHARIMRLLPAVQLHLCTINKPPRFVNQV